MKSSSPPSPLPSPPSVAAALVDGDGKRRSLMPPPNSYRQPQNNNLSLVTSSAPLSNPKKSRLNSRSLDSPNAGNQNNRSASTDSSALGSQFGDISISNDDPGQDDVSVNYNLLVPSLDSCLSPNASNRKGRSLTLDDSSEGGDTDLNSTMGSIFAAERILRQNGTSAPVGTNVYVLCRMRPPVKNSSQGQGALNFSNKSSISTQFTSKEEEEDDDEESEDEDEDYPDMNRPDTQKNLYRIRGNQVDCLDEHGGVRGTFEFTKIFNEKASQKKIFSNPEIIDILESLFLGFNGTMFTYGQTNAGKTFTMEGKNLRGIRTRGLIPRSISYIFDTISTISKQLIINKEKYMSSLGSPKSIDDSNNQNYDQNIEFTVSVSYYEIYCEKIRDLLNPLQDNMKLRETKKDGFVVQDLTEIVCNNEAEMLAVLEKGKFNRATAATLMNALSSRSHSIFCITIKQKITIENKVDDQNDFNQESTFTSNASVTNTVVRKSRLYLVDLAGSEKVSQTGAEGTHSQAHTNTAIPYAMPCIVSRLLSYYFLILLLFFLHYHLPSSSSYSISSTPLPYPYPFLTSFSSPLPHYSINFHPLLLVNSSTPPSLLHFLLHHRHPT